MSLLNNYKNDDENKQVTTFEILSEQQKKVNEKEFIKLKIYKSEIDKAIGNLKELKKVNQYMNLTTCCTYTDR
jgi:glutamyl-tRNA reductase